MKYSVLQNIKIKTSKGGLELLPGQVTALPYRVASKLLDEGRITPCDTALKPTSDEILQDVYLKIMHRINDSYIEGTIKYIQDHHKDLDTKIDEVGEQINEIWESCLQGKATLNDFEEALNTYQKLYEKHNVNTPPFMVGMKRYPLKKH